VSGECRFEIVAKGRASSATLIAPRRRLNLRLCCRTINPGTTERLADCRAGLRQGQDRGLLFEFQPHLATLHRAQLPALIVLADSQSKRRLGRLVDKDSKLLIVAADGANQRQLRTFDARRFWSGSDAGAANGAAVTTGGGRRDGEKIGRSRVLDRFESGISQSGLGLSARADTGVCSGVWTITIGSGVPGGFEIADIGGISALRVA
jgi:hypothetical protein